MRAIIKKTIEETYVCDLNENVARSVIAYSKIEECDLPTAVIDVCFMDNEFIGCTELISRDDDSIDVEDLQLTDKEIEMCAILLGDNNNIEQ